MMRFFFSHRGIILSNRGIVLLTGVNRGFVPPPKHETAVLFEQTAVLKAAKPYGFAIPQACR